MTNDDHIGIVFSGGGSRGSYQIGVWQALMDMGLSESVRSVYGTSVGAINGAAFVQSDIQLALDIWQHLNYAKVFEGLPANQSTISKRKAYFEWMRGAIRNRGVDVSPLKKLLRSSINESVIRNSKIDYGMVVFNLTERRAQYLIKEQIPEGKLVEYVIASATFPIFQPHRIEDHLYIDGGIYDNRPVGFFNGNKSIRKIIVVDVTMARHVWPTKRVKENIDIFYVRPSRLLGSPLKFNHNRIISNLDLGYNDTLKQLAHMTEK